MKTKRWRLAPFCAVIAALLAASCGAGDEPSASPGPAGNAAAALLPALAADSHPCEPGGVLRAELYGALDGRLEWSAGDMQCQGMPRPGGNGARLRFSGRADAGGPRISFIIAVPGIEQGLVAAELPSNVTIIDEDSARFFSTIDLDTCWTDVEAQYPLGDSAALHRVDGVLYCIAPLAEVNGDSSVSIPEARFSGLLDWNAK